MFRFERHTLKLNRITATSVVEKTIYIRLNKLSSIIEKLKESHKGQNLL